MFFVGLDLGQKQDFSAVAVVERDERGCMRVRYLERMALGTPYVKVVSRVSEIMRHTELALQSRLVVDATGVGAPVVEMLRAARPRYRVTAVTITAGEHAHGRARVAAVQQHSGRCQLTPAALDLHRISCARHLSAQLLDAVETARAIGSGGKIMKAAGAFRQRRQEGITVGNALVARQAQRA